MASMRWVTRKPPKMFTLAMISASEAEQLCESSCPTLDAAASTLDRKQRADHDHRRDGVGHAISGVCSAGVTLHTT